MRRWQPLAAVAVCIVLAFTGSPTQAADTLAVLLRIDPGQSLQQPFRVAEPKSALRFFARSAELDAFYASSECVAPGGRRHCAILDRGAGRGCLAVLFDSDQPTVTLKAFRIGRGPDPKSARLEAFKGSEYYNGVYFEERLKSGLLRPADEIDAMLYADEKRWADRIIGEKCL